MAPIQTTSGAQMTHPNSAIRASGIRLPIKEPVRAATTGCSVASRERETRLSTMSTSATLASASIAMRRRWSGLPCAHSAMRKEDLANAPTRAYRAVCRESIER
jgi:hypothetical protein